MTSDVGKGNKLKSEGGGDKFEDQESQNKDK